MERLPSDADLRSYRAFVEAASLPGAEAQPFVARLPAHAAIAVGVLFKRAQSIVQILTKSLNLPIYGSSEVYIEVLDFLHRTAQLRNERPGIYVLYEDDFEIEGHPLVQHIRERHNCPEFRSSIALLKIPESQRKTYSFHFTLSDYQHYRFVQLYSDSNSLVQFNDPAFGEQLQKIFQRLWEKGINAIYDQPERHAHMIRLS